MSDIPKMTTNSIQLYRCSTTLEDALSVDSTQASQDLGISKHDMMGSGPGNQLALSLSLSQLARGNPSNAATA